MSPSKARILRTGLSGVLATAVDVAALVFLVEVAAVSVVLAAFLSAMAGGVTNYLVNKFWAFRDPSPITLKQVTVYAAVSLTTALFMALSMQVLSVMMGLPYLVSKAIAASLVFILWTYPAQARLVFRAVPTPASSDAAS